MAIKVSKRIFVTVVAAGVIVIYLVSYSCNKLTKDSVLQQLKGFDNGWSLVAYKKNPTQKNPSTHVDFVNQTGHSVEEVFQCTFSDGIVIQRVGPKNVNVYYFSEHPTKSSVDKKDQVNDVSFEFIYLNVELNSLSNEDRLYVDSVLALER